MIATTKEPKLTLGNLAVLEVVDVGRIGAFLDWGLEKDLLLPFKEQTTKVEKGDRCLVSLYIDKSGRLCATMKVYPLLRTDSPYKKDDTVRGTVYEISRDFGVFVAVDDQFSALIPQKRSLRQDVYRTADRGQGGGGESRRQTGSERQGKDTGTDGCRCSEDHGHGLRRAAEGCPSRTRRIRSASEMSSG